MHALVCKGFDDEVMHRVKGIFGVNRSAQAILVGYHYQLVIQLGRNFWQVLQCAGVKGKLGEGIYLLIGRFVDEGTVAVYK
jgi:hypothetical protein